MNNFLHERAYQIFRVLRIRDASNPDFVQKGKEFDPTQCYRYSLSLNDSDVRFHRVRFDTPPGKHQDSGLFVQINLTHNQEGMSLSFCEYNSQSENKKYDILGTVTYPAKRDNEFANAIETFLKEKKIILYPL